MTSSSDDNVLENAVVKAYVKVIEESNAKLIKEKDESIVKLLKERDERLKDLKEWNYMLVNEKEKRIENLEMQVLGFKGLLTIRGVLEWYAKELHGEFAYPGKPNTSKCLKSVGQGNGRRQEQLLVRAYQQCTGRQASDTSDNTEGIMGGNSGNQQLVTNSGMFYNRMYSDLSQNVHGELLCH